MGFFPLHNKLWPTCICHILSAVSSLLLVILLLTVPDVFLIDVSEPFSDILYGLHETSFGVGASRFLVIFAAVCLIFSAGTGLLVLCGILNEREKLRSVLFYLELLFGVLSFIAMCMVAHRVGKLEGPIYFFGMVEGWQKLMDVQVCERAVAVEKEQCQASFDHLENCSGAQAQLIACIVFWLLNFLSLCGSAVWMAATGLTQIDAVLYSSGGTDGHAARQTSSAQPSSAYHPVAQDQVLSPQALANQTSDHRPSAKTSGTQRSSTHSSNYRPAKQTSDYRSARQTSDQLSSTQSSSSS